MQLCHVFRACRARGQLQTVCHRIIQKLRGTAQERSRLELRTAPLHILLIVAVA